MSDLTIDVREPTMPGSWVYMEDETGDAIAEDITGVRIWGGEVYAYIEGINGIPLNRSGLSLSLTAMDRLAARWLKARGKL